MNVKRTADILKYSAYSMILPLSVCKLKLKFFGLARETNNEKKWLFTSLLLLFFLFVPRMRWRSARNGEEAKAKAKGKKEEKCQRMAFVNSEQESDKGNE